MPDQDIPATTPQSPAPNDGKIIEVEIDRELKDSYLTYAMSTIMDRALPDVRDGLKPSQRRILVAMNDLGLRPNKKHLKCAKICGNTSGDYHPHGEGVIYPTLVNMAQSWRMRVPLIQPQGNFGSIEPDAPAAMRYTEARMDHAAVDLLQDLDLDTVDKQPNYDDRLMEPTVLPGKFPNLLINGSVGIAVGMATSLAPHNPTEVFDSIIRVIENPTIDLLELMQDVTDKDGKAIRHGIKGPDFPTGGVIMGRAGIVEAYATGRGKVTMRGSCHVEELGKDRQQIVIDSIPYMLGQRTLLEQIVEAVREEKIKDASDVRNESGREAQTRIVVELKKGADPRIVENQLYEFTSLQDTFSINSIALVGRRPLTLTLRQLIDEYVRHRIDVIRRRTAHLLREAKKEAHFKEALIYAVCDIDEVIRIIRGSNTKEQAIQGLMAWRFRIAEDHKFAPLLPDRLKNHLRAAEAQGGLLLTRKQAERIGEMRLIQLVGLEIEQIVNDYKKIVEEIEGYELILAEHARVLDIIKEDCEEMRARYNSPRKSQIFDSGEEINVAALIQQEDVAVTISHQGYAKRVPMSTYRAQGRGGKGIRASEAKDEDFIEHFFVASTHDDLLCFTDTGRVFRMKVYELPEMSRTARGRAIVNMLELRGSEKCCAFLAVKNFEEGSEFLTFASRQGIVKRTALKEYRNVNRGGIIAVGLKEGDALLDVALTHGNDDIILVSAGGMAIRFNEEDARLMGRQAAGVKGIELADGDEVIGAVRVPMVRASEDEAGAPHYDTAPDALAAELCLLTITEHGYGKRTKVDEYRVQPEAGRPRSQSRGGKGRADIKTTERNGRSVAALGVRTGDDVVVVTKLGQLVRIAAESISEYGRGTQGVRVASLNEGDAVIGASRVDRDPESEQPETPAA